jgi:hypothetical protein
VHSENGRPGWDDRREFGAMFRKSFVSVTRNSTEVAPQRDEDSEELREKNSRPAGDRRYLLRLLVFASADYV